MNRQVTVPLPLNIFSNERSLFDPYVSYELAPQKVKTFKNVFVTASGLCLNHNGLIKESHHNFPDQYSDYINEAAMYAKDIKENPENLIVLDDDNIYLVIHHPWYNYYHWICEAIFRLWMVRKKTDNLVLLLPEFYRNADFIMGSLEPFKLKNILFVPNGKSVIVKNLCLPQIKPVCDSYNKTHINGVRALYRNYITERNGSITQDVEKLYISREFAGRRRVVNQDNLLEILKQYGFTIFHPEKYSFLDQVAIYAQVKYLVGEHGSGLTNLLFLSKGSSILELHKNKTNRLDHPSPLFWYMADALGVNYYRQSCETHGKEDYYKGEYIVDCELFEKNLKLMLSR
ncbi:glycosyltransferase family 61 protein [Mucilaginibacter sp.]|uniref:glycosyltransferase family 61 protein n=1 Tax=Mucilaginibacter sp. TaxID=1882438 RepID=UPI002847B260|nr:glycosyltransferase family 61 protein [Mucilaginibacter sp.]MDR3694224.1 glycosyltransferase family 61 protein [Mucilaginibacter sp.]